MMAERADDVAHDRRRPPGLAAERGGDHVDVALPEQGRRQFVHHRHGEAAAERVGMVDLAAAKKQVDLAGDFVGTIRRTVSLPYLGRRLVLGWRGPRQVVRGRRGPGFVHVVGPPRLRRGGVFTGEIAADLGRAADVPPIDLHRLAVVLLVPLGKSLGELVADRLVVRRHDRQHRVARLPLPGRRRPAENERKRDDDREQGDDGKVADHAISPSAERRPTGPPTRGPVPPHRRGQRTSGSARSTAGPSCRRRL